MRHDDLAIYLNDHLAGAVSACELLDHLASAYQEIELGQFAKGLRAEITADKDQLEEIIARLGISQSMPRQATAWLGAKVAEFKLQVDDPAGKGLQLLQSMEALSLGIEGKRCLWQSLQVAGEKVEALRILDYTALIERAVGQRGRVEALRLAAAQAILS